MKKRGEYKMNRLHWVQGTLIFLSMMLFFSSFTVSSIHFNTDERMQEKTHSSSLFELSEDADAAVWPMFCHDARHTGRSAFSTVNTNGHELWRFKSESRIESGAIIDHQGILYVGDSSGHFYAIFPNGTLKWKVKLASSIETTPVFDQNGIIYVGTTGAYPKDYLYAIDSSNGSILWKYGTNIYSSPAISDDGTIYFGDYAGYVQAISLNGTVKWKYRISTAYFKAVFSSPAIGDDGTIYCGSTDGYLYALYPNGTLNWRFKLGDDFITCSPVIGDDGTIYCTFKQLFAINKDGSLKWKTNVGYSTTPAIGWDGTVYAGRSTVYAVSPETGQILWRFDPGDERKITGGTPCVCADGILYVGTTIDDVSGGEMIAIDKDGNERWRHTIANDRVESPPCIGEDGIVYVGSTSTEEFEPGKWTDVGYLYAFGPGRNTAPYDLTITGETQGRIKTVYSFQITAYDAEGSAIYYKIDWGDETNTTWIGPYAAGRSISIEHNWSEVGEYRISIQAKDAFDAVAEGITHHLNIEHNDPPQKPEISGRTRIQSGRYYTYSLVSTDPDTDDLFYFVDWGDGTNTGWIGVFPTGDTAKISHEWHQTGTYTIKAKTKDVYDAESDWGTLEVAVPKNNGFFLPLVRFLQSSFLSW